MLFTQETYVQRRRALREMVGEGVIVLLGNNDSPMNYPANAYKFRQDSTFLYFTGQHRDGLALVIDCEAGAETLVGDESDIDDIVWYGSVTSVSEMAAETGVKDVKPMAWLSEKCEEARQKGRRVHFLPPYRADHKIQLMDLLGIHPSKQKEAASLPLI